MNKRFAALTATLLIAGALAACGQKEEVQPTTPAESTPAPTAPAASPGATPGTTQGEGGSQTAQAESLYKAQCIACHGTDLGGGIGPNLQKAGSHLSEADVKNILLNGKGGMPAFKGTLSDADIQALSAWLAAKK
ncbi:cytochrome c [Paenibacillus sp. FJAT-26967]|uniref:c-type cytochrome n=1 Tax=Paenibacillus sp. FJAT-26967 TaxID=1729690 RepID=UPI0008389A20|nr:cytochrome c [Paenibacillus sp. FJAT-26967]